jgi:hypothetical protein
MKPPPDPTTATGSPSRSSATLSGCTTCSASAYGMLSCSWLSAALSSPTRRCDAGARNLVRVSPTACAAAGRGQGTSGTWTKSSSGSRACSITSGAPSIRMALCSTSSFRPGAMPTPRSASQAASEGFAIRPASDRDRQAEELWCRSASTASRHRPPTKPISDQSGRELASADATTRAADAAVSCCSSNCCGGERYGQKA